MESTILLSRKTGFEWPWNFQQIFAAVAQILISACFVALTVYTFDGDKELFTLVSVIFFFIISSICWFICENVDPSKPGGIQCLCMKYTQSKRRYCPTCRKYVVGLDHHCVWLNSCVGTRNYPFFVTLAFTVTVQHAIQAIVAILAVFVWDSLDLTFTEQIAFVLVCVGSILTVVAYGSLSYFHIYFMCIGKGTYDWMLDKTSAEFTMPTTELQTRRPSIQPPRNTNRKKTKTPSSKRPDGTSAKTDYLGVPSSYIVRKNQGKGNQQQQQQQQQQQRTSNIDHNGPSTFTGIREVDARRHISTGATNNTTVSSSSDSSSDDSGILSLKGAQRHHQLQREAAQEQKLKKINEMMKDNVGTKEDDEASTEDINIDISSSETAEEEEEEECKKSEDKFISGSSNSSSSDDDDNDDNDDNDESTVKQDNKSNSSENNECSEVEEDVSDYQESTDKDEDRSSNDSQKESEHITTEQVEDVKVEDSSSEEKEEQDDEDDDEEQSVHIPLLPNTSPPTTNTPSSTNTAEVNTAAP
eukprot:TRINITY_DN1042_c0_g2_i1.p1 TRINITY_DN1042_c0_g2~~TRINITY_DN1042_c0_g2_i1.p1  ORF type:complete len:528 (-),score=186.15 TRINITY_DN1042_c0_g2_i1:100-1683(-)